VRTLLLWLSLLFAAAAGVFYWASNYSTGWAASLCSDAPLTCANWQTFAYAAGVTAVGYLAMALSS